MVEPRQHRIYSISTRAELPSLNVSRHRIYSSLPAYLDKEQYLPKEVPVVVNGESLGIPYGSLKSERSFLLRAARRLNGPEAGPIRLSVPEYSKILGASMSEKFNSKVVPKRLLKEFPQKCLLCHRLATRGSPVCSYHASEISNLSSLTFRNNLETGLGKGEDWDVRAINIKKPMGL